MLGKKSECSFARLGTYPLPITGSASLVVYHLQKNSGNFGGNFTWVKNVHRPVIAILRAKIKNVAVNSLELVRLFKTCTDQRKVETYVEVTEERPFKTCK